MKKVYFNAAKSFEVPESWIENAVNAKPKKKPLLLRPYLIGTAASVVLAVAVTIFAVVATNRNVTKPKPPIPVKPQAATAATEESTAPGSAATQPPTEMQAVTQPVTDQVTEPATTVPNTKPATLDQATPEDSSMYSNAPDAGVIATGESFAWLFAAIPVLLAAAAVVFVYRRRTEK